MTVIFVSVSFMLIFSEKLCILAEFQKFHKERGYLEFRPNAQLLLWRRKQTLPSDFSVRSEGKNGEFM